MSAAICRKAFHYIPPHVPQQDTRVDKVHGPASRNAAPWLVADTQVVLDWLVFRERAARPVLEAVLGVMHFWLDMGIDGLRLDAVPYLVEREGTNNENLPETHEVLKKIRAEIDRAVADAQK